MIHTRTIRIDGIDGMKYYKVMKVNVGLSRKKEWFLKIKEFNIEAVDDKISCAKDKIKDQLRQLHKDYIEGTLDEKLRDVYAEYMKPYFLRSQLPQAESDKIIRAKNRDKKIKERVVAQEVIRYGVGVFNNEEDKFYSWLDKPNISLNNKIPKNLLLSDKGCKEVLDCLNRIRTGNYA